MHLHNPQRTRSFQARPGRGWQPLGYGELLPESRDYPFTDIYNKDDTVAALHASFQANAKVQYALAKCKAAQRRAAYALNRWLSSEGQDNSPVVDAEQDVIDKLVKLTNACMQNSSQRNQPWIPTIRHPEEEYCSIKYTRYSMEEGKNVTPIQAPEAWTCPMKWDHAQRFAADASDHDSQVEHCTAIYEALGQYCPSLPKTKRLKYLLEYAVQTAVFHAEHVTASFETRCEQPADTYTPTHIASVTTRDRHDGRVVHAICTANRTVRASTLWDNPRLVYALQKRIKWFTMDVGELQPTHNLMNLVVRITAPTLDDSERFETHVLEILPFAGPDSCTVTAIHIEHKGADSERDPSDGFLNLTKESQVDPRDPPGRIMGQSLSTYLCLGAHRNRRYGLHELVKIFCEKSLAEDGWIPAENIATLSDKETSALVWVTRHQEHDFLISTYRLPGHNAQSVILSVRYPPYITHWSHPTGLPSHFRHFPPPPAGHGYHFPPPRSVRPPRERVPMVSPDAPLHVPFFAQLIAGQPKFKDDVLLQEKYYMDFIALQGADLHRFQRARAQVEEFASGLGRKIATAFGANGGWQHDSFYMNILHEGWNNENGERLDKDTESAREMWFKGWDELIGECIRQKLAEENLIQHESPAVTGQFAHLLDVGAFKPRGPLDQNATKKLWARITGTFSEGAHYVEWLANHPTVPLTEARAQHDRPAQARHPMPAHHTLPSGPVHFHPPSSGPPAAGPPRAFKRAPPKQKKQDRYAGYQPRHHAGEEDYVPPASHEGHAPEQVQSVEPAPAEAPKERKMRMVVDRNGNRRYVIQDTKLSRKVVPLPPRTPPLAAKLAQLEQRLARSEQSANMEHLLTRLLSHLDLA